METPLVVLIRTPEFCSHHVCSQFDAGPYEAVQSLAHMKLALCWPRSHDLVHTHYHPQTSSHFC